MRIDILTLFPEICREYLSTSIIGRAQKSGKVDIYCHNIRDYTDDKHGHVDDTPYGGGKGMLMKAQPIADCFNALFSDLPYKPYFIYMSPKGETLTQQVGKSLLEYDHIVLLCGHYEGIDQRVIDKLVDKELSIGSYVLTGGELPALVVCDVVSRMLPGVLADDECFQNESHWNGKLEYPQYTRPYEWEGMKVPDVLVNGHHAMIEKWRNENSMEVEE